MFDFLQFKQTETKPAKYFTSFKKKKTRGNNKFTNQELAMLLC